MVLASGIDRHGDGGNYYETLDPTKLNAGNQIIANAGGHLGLKAVQTQSKTGTSFTAQGNIVDETAAARLRTRLALLVDERAWDRVLALAPRLRGAAYDAFSFCLRQVSIELNAHQQNPLALPEEDRMLPVANFDLQALSAALDFARIALAPCLTVQCERSVKLLQASQTGLTDGLESPGDAHGHGLSEMAWPLQALTAEARSSAVILACLPLVTGGMLYAINPPYIMTLFTHPTGRSMLGAAVLMLALGEQYGSKIFGLLDDDELREAIPPAYSEFIGRAALAQLERRAA